MSTEPTLSLLGRSALAYASRLGWQVLPLKPGAKTPITAHGFKDASTDPEQITAWWTQTPDANIGIATGAVSGISVLDVDVKHEAGGDLSLRALLTQHGTHLQDHVYQRTWSCGFQYIFQYDPRAKQGAGCYGKGLDGRNDGGYIVAPPSLVNGTPYKWIVKPGKLLPVPEWLLTVLTVPPTPAAGERRNPPGWADELMMAGVPMGERDHQAHRLIQHARETGRSEADCWARLTTFGRNCTPPFDPQTDDKIAAKITKAYAREPLFGATDATEIEDLSTFETVEVSEGAGGARLIETAPFPETAQIGLAHEYASLFEGHSDVPYAFSYLSFVTTFAAAVSSDAMLSDGFTAMPLRLYTVKIGPSYNSRKSASTTWALDLFSQLAQPYTYPVYIAAATPGWEVGLVKIAQKAQTAGKPVLIVPDEFTELTKKMSIQGATLHEAFNRLFDSRRVGSISKQFDGEAVVDLSLLSATTDKLWLSAFTSESLDLGFLNRLLLVPAYPTAYMPVMTAPDPAAVQAVLGQVEEALKLIGYRRPVQLRLVEEAEALYRAWQQRCLEARPDGIGMVYHDAYKRLDTYVRRLAGIFTLMTWGRRAPADGHEHPIDPLAMHAACAIGDWQFEARRWTQPPEADNPYALREAQLRAWLGMVLKPGQKIQRRVVQKRWWRWGTRATDWALKALESTGEIILSPGASTGSTWVTLSPEGLLKR